MIEPQPTAGISAPTNSAPPGEGRQHFDPSAISCAHIPLTSFQDFGLL